MKTTTTTWRTTAWTTKMSSATSLSNTSCLQRWLSRPATTTASTSTTLKITKTSYCANSMRSTFYSKPSILTGRVCKPRTWQTICYSCRLSSLRKAMDWTGCRFFRCLKVSNNSSSNSSYSNSSKSYKVQSLSKCSIRNRASPPICRTIWTSI